MLQTLPRGYGVFAVDGSWLIVGPTGLFVVALRGDDDALACSHAVDGAVSVRTHLADALHWVPFIDAIVVTDDRDDRHEGHGVHESDCTPVPPSALRATLCDGPRVIDDDSLARIMMVGLRRLDGHVTASSDGR